MAKKHKSLNINGRHIRLYGDIGTNMARDFVEALRSLDDTPGTIIVEITSDGGNADDALAMYHAMINTKNPVHTIGVASVKSSALYVFMGGSVRSASKNTVFMDHQAHVELEGSHNAKELTSIAKELDRLDLMFRKILEERTLKNARWWRRKSLTGDFNFGYDEARRLGVINEG